MATFIKIMACVCLMLILNAEALSKEWRGLVPLHSTCEDVKGRLGVTSCESSVFSLKDETVYIVFSTGACDTTQWNVPPGTVISIDVFPKKKLPITDFDIHEDKYKKKIDQHVLNTIYYFNEEEGITFTVYENKVMTISYTPAHKDGHLRCTDAHGDQSAAEDQKPVYLPKFDEYNDITFSEEKKRLDDFALQLNRYEPDTQGYIIFYGGLRARIGEAKTRAQRARNYLVNTHGLKAARIITIEGGYREEFTIELWIRPSGFGVPIATPTVQPRNVKIIK
jgi:hypothetical protein